MSNIIKFIRGAEADIPVLNQGEPAFTTDTHKVFIGDGAANHELLKVSDSIQCMNNASVAPAVTNDITEGYVINSIWTDTTHDKSYICVDNTEDNAVWIEITAIQLSDLTDVGVTTPTAKNALMADGDSWESRALVEADISDLGAYIESLIEDTSPELGGELDCGAHSVGFTIQTLTGDGTDNIDWRLGNYMAFTCPAGAETFTFTAPSNPCGLILQIKQDGTGGRDLTFPAAVKWLGTEPTWTDGGAGKTIIMSMRYDGTNYWAQATPWEV